MKKNKQSVKPWGFGKWYNEFADEQNRKKLKKKKSIKKFINQIAKNIILEAKGKLTTPTNLHDLPLLTSDKLKKGSALLTNIKIPDLSKEELSSLNDHYLDAMKYSSTPQRITVNTDKDFKIETTITCKIVYLYLKKFDKLNESERRILINTIEKMEVPVFTLKNKQ